MLQYLNVVAQDQSGDDKFNDEQHLYKVLKAYCFNGARIVEAGPDVGPWTPILLEHIAFEDNLSLTWTGIEKVDRNWHKENDYSNYVRFNQDICTFSGGGNVEADIALSIRPREYGVGNEMRINDQHRSLLNLVKTGGLLIIMIHKGEFHLIEPTWGPDNPMASVVTSVDADLNRILVLRKK